MQNILISLLKVMNLSKIASKNGAKMKSIFLFCLNPEY